MGILRNPYRGLFIGSRHLETGLNGGFRFIATINFVVLTLNLFRFGNTGTLLVKCEQVIRVGFCSIMVVDKPRRMVRQSSPRAAVFSTNQD
jgi:hypothetical protein